MIEIKSLTKSYDKPVLHGVDLTIEDGSIYGLIGVNGAGKTTLLDIISGIMEPEFGICLIDGLSAFDNTSVKKKIFYLPDEPYYSKKTTPQNLIEEYELFYDLDKEKYFKYIKLFKLPLNKTMDKFSKGMKRQTFASLALAIKPKYLLLDEAFDGLDPFARKVFLKELLRIQAENDMTIIISSHSLRELTNVCDSYGILENGIIKSSSNISESLDNYHKYNIVFEKEVNKEDFSINFKSFKKEKRFITCITDLNKEQMKEAIKALNPILFEEIHVGLEEIFLLETKEEASL